MRKSHWQQRKTAGYETRGCDTPGRFAMDERDGNFRELCLLFKIGEGGKTMAKQKFVSV